MENDPQDPKKRFPKAFVSYLLLHWDEAITFPSITTSSKPVPLAKIQRPPVASWACSAVHSDLDLRFKV